MATNRFNILQKKMKPAITNKKKTKKKKLYPIVPPRQKYLSIVSYSSFVKNKNDILKNFFKNTSIYYLGKHVMVDLLWDYQI